MGSRCVEATGEGRKSIQQNPEKQGIICGRTEQAELDEDEPST